MRNAGLENTSPNYWQLHEVFIMGALQNLFCREDGQDVAEYAIMLGVILAIVVATIQLIGSGANNVFSSVASSIQ
jgi:Flp pilus assembly pilin Flp